MGILDWFKNRQGQFDSDHVSPEMMDWAVEEAVTVTNPKLKLLPDCRKRLMPAIEATARFLRPQLMSLPAAQLLSPCLLYTSDAADE